MLIKAQDKEYILKFDINALAKFEDVADSTISKALNDKDMSIKTLRFLVYAGLSSKNKDITLETSGDIMQSMIDENGLESMISTITKAFEESNFIDNKKK